MEAVTRIILAAGQWLRNAFQRFIRSEQVREAVGEGRFDQPYAMVPADDGGESYEMKCKICGELGNVLASRFIHAPGCPVDIEEKNVLQRRPGTPG